MPSKLTLIFQVTTIAQDPAKARNHTGGWTESLWRPGTETTKQTIDQYAEFRARLLPRETSIVGYRQQVYTLDGNSLKAGGASTGNLNQPGNNQLRTDLPQVSLQCALRTADAPNIGRLMLRGIPDDQMFTGEFNPTPQFDLDLKAYLALLAGLQTRFLGRNLINQNVRIESITANVMTTAEPTGAGAGNYVRLLRCRDTFGRPVNGTFRCSSVVGNVHTLVGFDPNIIVLNSGRARLDMLQLFPVSGGTPGRARVKKIGRPFESFRGRASKRSA